VIKVNVLQDGKITEVTRPRAARRFAFDKLGRTKNSSAR